MFYTHLIPLYFLYRRAISCESLIKVFFPVLRELNLSLKASSVYSSRASRVCSSFSTFRIR